VFFNRVTWDTTLDQQFFLKVAPLVDPAAILGLDLAPVSHAGIGLQPDRRIGGEHDPLGLGLGPGEVRTQYLGAKGAVAFLVLFHGADEVLHISSTGAASVVGPKPPPRLPGALVWGLAPASP